MPDAAPGAGGVAAGVLLLPPRREETAPPYGSMTEPWIHRSPTGEGMASAQARADRCPRKDQSGNPSIGNPGIRFRRAGLSNQLPPIAASFRLRATAAGPVERHCTRQVPFMCPTVHPSRGGGAPEILPTAGTGQQSHPAHRFVREALLSQRRDRAGAGAIGTGPRCGVAEAPARPPATPPPS
jgi:hypothetical protein